jgi:hypothetical protein
MTLAKMGKGFGEDSPNGGILIGFDGTLYGAAGEPGIIFAIR